MFWIRGVFWLGPLTPKVLGRNTIGLTNNVRVPISVLQTSTRTFSIMTLDRKFRARAESAAVMHIWIAAINAVTSGGESPA